MKKRNIVTYILIALVAAGAAAAGIVYKDNITSGIHRAFAVASGKDIKPLLESEGRYIRQIVAKDNSTERTVMWQSDNSEEEAVVEYRTASGDGRINRLNATNKVFTDDGETTYIHEVTLEGLIPDTAYEYRVGYGDDRRSDWYKLKTPGPHASYEVLIYPDSQSADYSEWIRIVRDSAQRNPNASLYISMGDLVDNGEQASQWRTWLRSISPLSKTVPLSPMLGNHEMYTVDWKMRDPKAYLAYFKVPENGNDTFDRRYYSYDFGDVHYVVLDTQLYEANHDDNRDEHHPDLYDEQIRWLRQDLTNNKQKWTVVMMHRDPFQYAINGRTGREAGFSEEGVIFMPIFDEFNVDLVLSAHLHTYRNRGHVRNFDRSTDGPLYIITGIAGDVRYPGLWANHPLDVYVAPQPETNNYMTMQVTPETLTIRSFLPDGTLLEETSLTK